MINEVVEVKDYLDGKNINEKCLYRICYMMAKWYKQEGFTHMEIRNAIFAWGKEYGVYITYNLNGIIRQALEDKQRLKDNVIVKINQNDIDEIKKRFDSKNTRLLSLALLCYAKANANQDGEFSISSVALSNWIGINQGNMVNRHLMELIDFGYICRVVHKQNYTWNRKDNYKKMELKILIPWANSGGIELIDNKIIDLYESLF